MTSNAAPGQVWLWTKDGQIGGIYLLSHIEDNWWMGHPLYSLHWSSDIICRRIDNVDDLREGFKEDIRSDNMGYHAYRWKRIT